jgi:hypothetical protein
MKRTMSALGLFAAALFLGGFFLGCEDSGTDPHWIAPKNISGTWLLSTNSVPDLTYDLRIVISQSPSTTVTRVYSCRNCEDRSEYTVPATYDDVAGVLTVNSDYLSCWVSYYRFESETQMREVYDPSDTKVEGPLYFRQ